MCQDRMTVPAVRVQGDVMPDGCVVTIVELKDLVVGVENQRTGAMFQPPPAGILLLLSPGPDTLLYSLDQLMAAFSASLFVLATLENEPGSAIQQKWIDYFAPRLTS